MCARTIGLEDVRTAILCMAVDNGIVGLLIRGPTGTGKSEMVRNMAVSITGHPPVVVPHGCTEEQLFGGMDVESVITKGEIRLEKGLLGRSEGRIMMVDDINLFDRRFVRGIMDSVISGEVRVEREGMSFEYPCHTNIVATMSSREVPMNHNLSDLFDMSVMVTPSEDSGFRREVLRIHLEGDDSPIEIPDLEEARRILPHVILDDGAYDVVAEANDRFGCRGYRGMLSSIRVSRALAALNGRTEVSSEDVSRALYLCLGHRRGRVRKEVPEDDGSRVTLFGDSHIMRCIHDDRKVSNESSRLTEDSSLAQECQPVDSSDSELEDVIEDVGELFESIDLVEDSRRAMGTDVRRKSVISDEKDGRYISSRPFEKGDGDIAIDATLRHAAPFQRIRRKDAGSGGLIIEASDLRTKVRESRISCTFIFMIDNSGSLVIRSRMRAVKAAVLSILSDHLSRRDRVAIMTFNETFVGMMVPPTRSVGVIRNVLEDIPVGKKTPLSEALSYMSDYLSMYTTKHPSEQCFVVVMTDAMANISMVEGVNPFEEALTIASHVPHRNVEWVVVDTAAVDDSRNMPDELAKALSGAHYRLDDLRSSDGIVGR